MSSASHAGSHGGAHGRKDAPSRSSRRSLLEIAPLELECMNLLWPMERGTVREIRDALAARRPRAYTTIMTIMDRLARKGIVVRRKAGRAYVYEPNLTAREARSHAIAQLVQGFFGGSHEDLMAHLSAASPAPPSVAAPPSAPAPLAAKKDPA